MESGNDSTLFARALGGDIGAFQRIYEAHHLALFRFAYRLTGMADVAEDVTQECFVRLMRQRNFEAERGSLRQYLYGIVRNLVRQRRQREAHNVDLEELACQPVSDPIVMQELSSLVQAAISALPYFQREAIALCEFQELTLQEAAAVAEVDVGTMKSRLHRARQALRRLLSSYRSQVRMPLSKGN